MRKSRFTEHPDRSDSEIRGRRTDGQGRLPGVRRKQRHVLQMEIQVRRHGGVRHRADERP